jgi:twinkle protein
MKFLYEHKQRPVPTTEKNVVLTNCPHCIKVKKNSFAAYLNLQKGTYQCKTCKTKGSFQEFSKTLLKKVAKPGSDDAFAILSTSDLLHSGTKHTKFNRPIEEIESYPKLLAKDTATLDQLCNTHHIDKDTWELYKVGTSTVEGRSCLTFPQTALSYDPNDTTGDHVFKLDTVRLKVCELEDPSNLLQMDPPAHSKEASVGLFGYQTASAESDTLIMTRRELDAMAAYQATGIPSVSIPTSNYQLQESVLPLLERFTRIYLWLDDDVDGQLAAERFAHKIGDSKCLLVSTRQGDKQGPLTAYDALKERKDLKKIVASARRIKHDEIVDFRDLREEVYNEILHPDQTRGVQSKDLPALNRIMKGHRPGELTILTGPTGAGKTTIISQLSLDYCQSGVPTLWGSFEILNKRLAKKMLYQFAGKDISLAPEEFDHIADRFEQVILSLTTEMIINSIIDFFFSAIL